MHPASLSTGQNCKAQGQSPRAAGYLLPSPGSAASVDTTTISALHNLGVTAEAATGSLDSEPPSARATVDKQSTGEHDELDAVLMAHTSSHIRLRWLPGRPPNNVMVRLLRPPLPAHHSWINLWWCMSIPGPQQLATAVALRQFRASLLPAMFDSQMAPDLPLCCASDALDYAQRCSECPAGRHAVNYKTFA